jgi:dihydropyrimidine dehydrogenase (NAD+) subunit PreT
MQWLVTVPDDRRARLAPEQYASNFCEAHGPLDARRAQLEAERCYYCHDAPCTTACPTGIDVPTFIGRIADGNLRGAAATILSANPLGGMCARVCPTEVLCEQACVRNSPEAKPVAIGELQRFATDRFFSSGAEPLFKRATSTGRQIAVVGAGPAGLACAHRLALAGHAVTLFDARPKLGGLNEYGLAAYKTTGGFAQQEVAWLLSVGGIEVRIGARLGQDLKLDELVRDYDAVFLGIGLGAVNSIGIPEPELIGLGAAVDFISDLRQATDLGAIPVGRKVLVIGGGMTAVDAAVQARKLGAEEVTIVYRRGLGDMPASGHERDWAKLNGVLIREWATPIEVLGESGRVTGMRFARTRMEGGKLVTGEESFVLAADMVLKAIGQTLDQGGLEGRIEMRQGRIVTDDEGRTSHPGIWAGGDCRLGGLDLTVEAVEHGKLAAASIAAALKS